MISTNGFFSKRWLTVFTLLCMVTASGCIARPTPDSLIIQRTAYFKEGARANDKIRDECGLEQEVPRYIKKYASGDYDSIFFSDTLSDSTPAKVLVMKIVNAQGLGGGRMSGPKSVTIEGILTQNGQVLGSFTAHRASMGGYGGGGHGTCAILVHRCGKKIGKDVGQWLKKPTMNAVLGTAKANSIVDDGADEKDDEK